MTEWFARLKTQVSEIVGEMSPTRKIVYGGVLGLVLLLLIFFGWRAANPSYATLFSRLTPEDAGEIVAVLQDRGIAYRITDNGTTILIPEERVHETRLNLAGQGMPRGGVVGFEIFLESALGATDFDRQVRYNMALQGELTRTIRELDGVQDARVHIVVPERRLFVRDERPATASVFLQLRPGASLSGNQVRGITNLLARSVEGLEPENVTIVDNWGQVLSDLVRPAAAGLGDNDAVTERLEIQRAFERELELRTQTVLERVYGLGRAMVQVNAKMNFDLAEQREELFEPIVRDEGIPRSTQVFEEESTMGPGAGGVVGVDANIPGFVGEDEGGGTFSRREEIINFELNRIENVRVQAPGGIDRLSVGVWIDGELEDEEARRVQDLVSAALGIDLVRGDTVIVDSMPFAVQPTVPTVADADVALAWPLWVWLLIGAAVLLLVIVWRRRARRAPVPTPVPGLDVVVDDDLEPAREETPEERERRALRERAADLAEEHPREVAALVKVWLTEG